MRTEHDIRDAFTAVAATADRSRASERGGVVIPADRPPARVRRRVLLAATAVATATAAVAAPAALSILRADAPIEPATSPTPPDLGDVDRKTIGKTPGITVVPGTGPRTPHGTAPAKVKVPASVIGTHRPATPRATSGDLFHVDLPAGWKQVSSSPAGISQSMEFTAPGGHQCVAKVYVRGGLDPRELPDYAAPMPINGNPGYWVDALLSAGVVDGAVVWRYADDSWAVTSCGSLDDPSGSDPYGRDRTLEKTLAKAVAVNHTR